MRLERWRRNGNGVKFLPGPEERETNEDNQGGTERMN